MLQLELQLPLSKPETEMRTGHALIASSKVGAEGAVVRSQLTRIIHAAESGHHCVYVCVWVGRWVV